MSTPAPAHSSDPAPADVAGLVLTAISAAPHALDMHSWYSTADDQPLTPEKEPGCDTTLCVAGWTAHLTGWTLINGAWARRDTSTRLIDDVARHALGLTGRQAGHLFHTDRQIALLMLRQIAAGQAADYATARLQA
ncbi:hypothetical protein [Kitasatospora azatica]|uniref:hypothetical protein n=1 Tax=Kitasatospora azatica TaxID=58347 RepID=UPI00056CDA05|nr:hypothetical protein [Kitasatospora azatica]